MRPARITFALALIGAFAVFSLSALTGCAQAENTPRTTDPTTTQPVSPGNEPQLQADPDAPSVEIRGQQFRPEKIEIEAGQSVTWTNSDPAPHTVTGQGGLASPALQQGQSYTHTFEEPGEYWYACTIHPTMRGDIVVK